MRIFQFDPYSRSQYCFTAVLAFVIKASIEYDPLARQLFQL